MAAEIVNLRQVRKRKARSDAAAAADANRVAHGTPKALRAAAEALRNREAERHEAHRLSPAAGDVDGGSGTSNR